MKRERVALACLLMGFGVQTHLQAQSKPKQIKAEQHKTQQLPDYNTVTPTPQISVDSTQFRLKDYKFAARIDSIWQAELLNSDLFPKMQESILESPYKDTELSASDYQALSTKTLKERLAVLDSKTPFDINYHPELEKMIHIYLGRNKKYMERLMSLSQYYFPLFEKELAKHNMPLELKYLPIIESALNPRAKSYVGATGLWQFMFGTARQQGLTVSSYVDERMDPVKSTVAAVEYLQDLYNMFGDWDLALAAYNSGPGNVSRAIRRSGGEKDYWKLKRYLPRETANYVPAFLSVMYVFNYAQVHGFEPYQPEVVYYQTDTIHVKQTLKFEQIEDVTGINADLLAFLNPSYKLKIIPHIKGKTFALRLPIKELGLFLANEEVIYGYIEEEMRNARLPRYYEPNDRIRYRVRSGDYLGRIADKFGVSISQIKKWNHLSGSRIRAGQYLSIYPQNTEVLLSYGKATTSEKAQKSKSSYYTVRKGDSLWSISRKFSGVSISEIKKWNDISGSNLKPGMRLKISQS